eukprot:scaffold30575_cov136-Skeletonema_dohrnii-CCMP3373.AAC.1
MSEDNMSNISICASCGIAEVVDEVVLKDCADCDLVRYCSIDCEQGNRSHHKDTCKKRVAELRDELLFKQPESSHLGDCPICMIPLPLDTMKTRMEACCSKVICIGCDYANFMRDAEESLDPKCTFCRQPVPATNDEAEKYRKKRIEANDPVAIHEEGLAQHNKGDYIRAFEYYAKAAEVGNVGAHYDLSCMYRDDGQGVEKDRRKEIHHLEEAAIGGHPHARYRLGCIEEESGIIERAVRHWNIAAKQGHDSSIKLLLEMYKWGCVKKEVLAVALRAHQAAVDATKSPHRNAAEEFWRIQDNSNAGQC